MARVFVQTTSLLLFLVFCSAAQATLIFEAVLNGAQEVPPVATAASGTATLTLNNAQDRLEMMISILGIDLDGNQTPGNAGDDLIAAHIHSAPFGVNGGVAFGLVSPNSDLNGDLLIDPVAGTIFSAWDANEGLAAELGNLSSNGLYFNFHTNRNPAGEIRGQIVRVPEPTTLALMTLGLAGLGYSRRKAS